MKKVICLLAVAGCSSVACAQDVLVSALVSNDISPSNPSATVTVFAQSNLSIPNFGPANVLFDLDTADTTAILGDVNATTPFQNGPSHGMGSTDQHFTNGDFFRGLVIDVAGTSQPGAYGDMEPVEVGSFTVSTSDFTTRQIDVDITGEGSAIMDWVYFGIVFSWGAIATNPTGFDAVATSVNVVPAPGAAALLGLGGLVATRRRRS